MTAERRLLRRYVIDRLVPLAVLLLVVWLMVAYLVLPAGWRWLAKRHPALDDAPTVTFAGTGLPGDPLNVAFVGSKDDLLTAMAAAHWRAADPVTPRARWESPPARCCVARTTRPRSATFSCGDARKIWPSSNPWAMTPGGGIMSAFGDGAELTTKAGRSGSAAATFDRKVGFSHTTVQITHHIDANVDAERDKLLGDLRAAGWILTVQWLDGFQKKLEGRNGGGDPYHTDGRLAVGVLAAEHE